MDGPRRCILTRGNVYMNGSGVQITACDALVLTGYELVRTETFFTISLCLDVQLNYMVTLS
jgi:hypothetical protein